MTTMTVSDDFLAEVLCAVQNYRYVKLHTQMSTLVVMMIDYQPVGESHFICDGKERSENFKQFIKRTKIIDWNA